MIFTKIAVENIGTFHGRHEIDLAPESDARPIVLIGALNGSGKTTLLEAFQLALYGRRAKALFRINGSYDEYIQKLQHRQSTSSDHASIELSLRSDESGERIDYRVVRSWTFRKSTPLETLDVYVGNTFDEALTDLWDEEVERLLPLNLAHLFFFDGERIETLADPDRSADVLRIGIQSLLGLELVDQLRSDLAVLRRRLKREGSPGDDSMLKNLESEGEQIEQARAELTDQLANLNAQVDSAESAYKKARETFAKHGGDAYVNSAAMQAERTELIARIREADQALREIAAGPLPLVLVAPLLEQLARTSRDRIDAKHRALIGQHLSKRDSAFVAWFEDLDTIPSETVSAVRDYLAESRAPFVGEAGRPNDSVLDDASLHSLESLINGQLDELTDRATKISRRRKRLSGRLDSVDRAIEHVPDESVIASYIERQAVAKNELDSLLDRKRNIEEHLRKNAASMERNSRLQNRELDRLSDIAHDDRTKVRMRDYSLTVQHTLQGLRKKTLARHIASLENEITQAFAKLVRKDSLVQCIRINADNFSISLLGSGDRHISPNLLSAGERQILAIAILWGLGKAASRKMPIVIDTPLGRLDSQHRRRLVEQYFPEASHQVILLSTDEEIDAPLLDELDAAVTHKYTLDFVDSKASTAVRQGYFGESA